MPFVYIVRCADDTLYTGWAVDVTRRVQAHNAGRGARYTRMHRPVVLVYSEEVASRSEALKRELAIKRFPRAKKLALCGNQTNPRPRAPGAGDGGRRTKLAQIEGAGDEAAPSE